eukprot:7471292-Lingulodinium_polyedra.AAC.1
MPRPLGEFGRGIARAVCVLHGIAFVAGLDCRCPCCPPLFARARSCLPVFVGAHLSDQDHCWLGLSYAMCVALRGQQPAHQT